MRTESNSGSVVVDHRGDRRRAVRGTWHEIRILLVALAFALGLLAAGFVAGYILAPAVYGQMPSLQLNTLLPFVSQ